MKSWFSTLNPTERRFVVGVGLLFFIVINLLWVRPHFADWGKLQKRLDAAHKKQEDYRAIQEKAERVQADLAKMEPSNAGMQDENQAIEFLRTIQTQAAQALVQFTGSSRATTVTNKFFIEQMQTIKVVAEENQLVDFLYNLGAGNSLIRVRGMSVRPDQPQTRYRLSADITLVASYQKKTPVKTAPAAAAAKTGPAQKSPAPAPAAKPASPARPALPARPGPAQTSTSAPAIKPAIAKPAASPAVTTSPTNRPAPVLPPAARSATNRPSMPAFKLPTVRTSPPAAKPPVVPPSPPKNQ